MALSSQAITHDTNVRTQGETVGHKLSTEWHLFEK